MIPPSSSSNFVRILVGVLCSRKPSPGIRTVKSVEVLAVRCMGHARGRHSLQVHRSPRLVQLRTGHSSELAMVSELIVVDLKLKVDYIFYPLWFGC